jgi:hypothetical protein
MMRILTLKLTPLQFKEIEKNAAAKGISMEKYSIEALEFYNRNTKRELLANAFDKASALVRESSMEINAEFDQLVE